MEKTDKALLPKTVDEYLALQTEPVQELLQQVRGTIRAAAPKAEELISYQMPGYRYLKQPLVYFAAWPKHLALYGVGKKHLELYKVELKPFKISGTTIHFTLENPLPMSLIEKIVKIRLEENELNDAAKKEKRK